MLSFVADENFNNDILRGVWRRNPSVDIVRVQDIGLSGADDATVLEWAAQQNRIVLTHDVTTSARALMNGLIPNSTCRAFLKSTGRYQWARSPIPQRRACNLVKHTHLPDRSLSATKAKAWMTTVMANDQYANDLFVNKAEQDRVWEAVHEAAANIVLDNGVVG